MIKEDDKMTENGARLVERTVVVHHLIKLKPTPSQGIHHLYAMIQKLPVLMLHNSANYRSEVTLVNLTCNANVSALRLLTCT